METKIPFATASEFLQYSLANADCLPGEEQKFLKHYYRSWGDFSSDRMRHWYDFQLRDIERLLKEKVAPKLLDAGCGTGTESLWFALNGADVTAIDIDDHLLAVANARRTFLIEQELELASCRFKKQKILDATGTYDFIWLEQAFHHMEPREDVVAKLADLLAPEGYILFCETNAWTPLLQYQFYRLRKFKFIIRHQGEIWGNERVLTPGRLAKHMAGAGLSVEHRNYFRIFPSGERFDRMLSFEKTVEQAGLSIVAPFLFTHYGLVAQKPA